MPQYQGVWSVQEAARLQSQQQWVTDPYYKNTTLLLQADNAANSAQNNTFLDSSSNAFAITRNGNTTQGTFTPFSQVPGAWSNYFNGSSYLQIATNSDFAFGANNFTIECWVNGTINASGYTDFCGDALSSSGVQFIFGALNGKLVFTTWTTAVATGATAVPSNQWNHVLVSRVSGTTRLFLNGVLDGSGTDSNVYTNVNAFDIGYAGNAQFTGYISNLRVVKGAGVTSVTVPTSPLSPIANTVLLTCQSSSFIDTNTQTTAKTLTVASGTPFVQALSPFAPQYQYDPTVTGGSGYFDGSTAYLSSGAAAFGSGSFTMEFWVYPTSFAAASTPIYSTSGGTKTDQFAFQINATTGVIIAYVSGSSTWSILNGSTLGTLILNQWNHVALVRNTTDFRGYVNGVQTASLATSSVAIGTISGFTIGQNGAGSAYFPGYITGVRQTVGSALYTTSTITLPTAPFTASANTQLLLNFTNAGIYDGTLKNNLQTVGNAQVSTAVVKYGSGSMYFNGTTDYLKGAKTDLTSFGTGDFTIEGWLYFTTVGAYEGIFATGAYNTGQGTLRLTSSSAMQFYLGSGAESATGTQVYATNRWYHVAVVRQGSSLRIYTNGVLDASLTTSTSITGTTNVYVGLDQTYYMAGYIDDLRITKGLARYTANFIPPSVALPRQ